MYGWCYTSNRSWGYCSRSCMMGANPGPGEDDELVCPLKTFTQSPSKSRVQKHFLSISLGVRHSSHHENGEMWHSNEWTPGALRRLQPQHRHLWNLRTTYLVTETNNSCTADARYLHQNSITKVTNLASFYLERFQYQRLEQKCFILLFNLPKFLMNCALCNLRRWNCSSCAASFLPIGDARHYSRRLQI